MRCLGPCLLSALILICAMVPGCADSTDGTDQGPWFQRPPEQWPQITMINEIEYDDQHHPVAGCGFLLDTGTDTLAVTAKHVLTYFKSGAMSSVSFRGTLKEWKMYPKDNPADVVIVDSRVIGLMSQKAGPLQRVSSLDYPLEFLGR